MRIGIPKEIKHGENRVAITPPRVKEITKAGHQVCVEHDAGKKSGHLDKDYVRSGARIVDADEAYSTDLVLKVKRPLPEEYNLLCENQILFTYLHFDENIPPEQIEAIVDTGVTGIAYEWVEHDGKFPLLEPMSKISGAVFARRALELLMIHKGQLGGAYVSGVAPARAMVIGIGRIGTVAAQVLARNGVRLVLVDKHPSTINERMAAQWKGWDASVCVDVVIPFDEQNPQKGVAAIREELPNLDIVIGCAVRRPSLPKSRCPYLIDRDGVRTMRPGSVLCDATACERDFFETCVSSEDLLATYIDEGVVHYNCDHVPSLVAPTATELLSRATFTYVRLLLEGFENAVTQCRDLKLGSMCYRRKLTHQYSAEKKGLPWTSLEKLLR